MLMEGGTMRHLCAGGGRLLHLPAVEFEAESQLPVVDDCVPSHVLLGPDAVGQSLLQPAEGKGQHGERRPCTTRFTQPSPGEASS